MSDRTALVKELLANAVHIGARQSYWSPKMRDYVYGVQNGIHVFDLFKTVEKLEEFKAALEKIAKEGKEILFVGTKIQTQNLVKELATSSGHHYVNTKWVPGLVTNFNTIKKRIAVYNQLEKSIANGELAQLPKKEQAMAMRDLERLQKAYEGVKNLKRTPDAVFVVDGHYEGLALAEARAAKVVSFALLGTTGDIDGSDFFVPMNVNSVKALEFILGYLRPVLTRTERKQEVRADGNISVNGKGRRPQGDAGRGANRATPLPPKSLRNANKPAAPNALETKSDQTA